MTVADFYKCFFFVCYVTFTFGFQQEKRERNKSNTTVLCLEVERKLNFTNRRFVFVGPKVQIFVLLFSHVPPVSW